MSADYLPRTKPLIPVGHETWCAVSRVPIRSGITTETSDDEQIEWFLRAITAPGADSNQRRYDLESLAAIVTRNPSAGYGIRPIDSDTHDGNCIVCGDASVYNPGGHDVDFDTHPYAMRCGEYVVGAPEEPCTQLANHETPHDWDLANTPRRESIR